MMLNLSPASRPLSTSISVVPRGSLPDPQHFRHQIISSSLPEQVSERVKRSRESSSRGSDAEEPYALCNRRGVISSALAAVAATSHGRPLLASAASLAPAGLRLQVDKIDGYSFLVPQSWLRVTTSGNEILFRNPARVSENLFVGLSSPSSRKYLALEDLGSPDQAAKRTLRQYFDEFGTSRLGVKREGEVLSASRRIGTDGQPYYDMQLRFKSYASRNQLAVYQSNVEAGVRLEWDRRYVTVLGVANKRLYEFRLQTDNVQYEKAQADLQGIAESFRCQEVET